MRRKPAAGWRRWMRIGVLGLGGALVAAVLVVGGLWLWAGGDKTPADQISWGVTYSTHVARELGLDPAATYRTIVTELKPDRLRLVAYWTDIEPADGRFDYGDLDAQVAGAEAAGIPYVIAVGRKVPRYPECYTPDWAKGLSMAEQHERILAMLERTVKRYEGGAHLATWQVENEPFLNYGICPAKDEAFLKQEVELVDRLSSKPILLTDSGELTTWLGPSKYGHMFGTTLYRAVLNPNGDVFRYMWWPDWYTRRGNLIKKLRPNVQKLVVAELQAEPWGLGPDKPQSFYDRTMSHEQFADNIRFTQDVGFSEAYMWGVEWWYFEKTVRDDDYYWKTAQALF